MEKGGHEDYQFFRRLFPYPHRYESIFYTLAYEKAKEMYPQRFDPKKVGEIFSAWLEEPTARQLRADTPFSDDLIVLYRYEKIVYRSTIYCKQAVVEHGAEKRVPWFFVKLANDGFLYKRESEIGTTRTNVSRNGGSNWSQLKTDEFLEPFSPIVRFAKQFLNSEHINVRLWYNFELERLDVWFRSDSAGLAVSFKPGFPEQDFSADAWDTC
ncbi:hypothetical protein pmac_cds_868 [Pandoravirus macleodensis]|uniref:Uncharacterized protein n=1 Tax=Pandoravirus macleodensis TaxID=2107707 RepID=A0A2U7UGF9_9VIRU|nr:hypothetical protein pmac_cds_868 [Pandoravirus macleodensis]AVK77556.1 hypothetical protein pmac_cds_868 [Pandoravirus macleodensis]